MRQTFFFLVKLTRFLSRTKGKIDPVVVEKERLKNLEKMAAWLAGPARARRLPDISPDTSQFLNNRSRFSYDMAYGGRGRLCYEKEVELGCQVWNGLVVKVTGVAEVMTCWRVNRSIAILHVQSWIIIPVGSCCCPALAPTKRSELVCLWHYCWPTEFVTGHLFLGNHGVHPLHIKRHHQLADDGVNQRWNHQHSSLTVRSIFHSVRLFSVNLESISGFSLNIEWPTFYLNV